MKKSNFLLMLLSCLFLYSCNEDPVFEEENLVIELREHAFIPGYTDVDVSCIVYSNVSLRSVIMEYSTDKQLSRPFSVALEENGLISDYLQEGEKYYNKNIAGLENNTVYYCRIKIRSSTGYEYKEDFEFTTQNLSTTTVTTHPATDVSYTYATLNGQVISVDGINTTETGFYYSEYANMSNAISVKGNKYNGVFYAKIQNLEPNKIYYFQAYAIINGETCQGQILQFTTNEYTKAQVTTNEPVTVGYVDAKVSYVINDGGNSTITESGIIWGESRTLDITSGTKVKGSSNYANTTYYVTIKDLSAGDIYYYRAYAINSAGISYGQVELIFTKILGEVSVITEEATNVKRTSARLHYSVISEGYKVVHYGFIFNKKDNVDLNPYTFEGNAVLNVGYSEYGKDLNKNNAYYYIQNLSPDTYYEYQAFIQFITSDGEEEIFYGEVESFYTLE